jgi:hypothetical protein
MNEDAVRILEIGIAGIVVTMATYLLGMFRVELLGVVFSLTTLAGQSVIVFLEHFSAAQVNPGSTDPSA